MESRSGSRPSSAGSSRSGNGPNARAGERTRRPRTTIQRPTHNDGIVDPEYLDWLRDTLDVFDDDATVKKAFLDRLDPDCLEALDFNLSAGRHKPFVFDPGEHRPPAELIGELQGIYQRDTEAAREAAADGWRRDE